uniref:MICOS complex subunit MIC60 n=1 Tax=Eptatretus burgeri TaxID=7764 RepID=A0A8C4NBD5_EPTBU
MRCYSVSKSSSGSTALKVIGGSLMFVGGGVGGAVLYATWDPKFRTKVEGAIPYSNWLFGAALGPTQPHKPVSVSLFNFLLVMAVLVNKISPIHAQWAVVVNINFCNALKGQVLVFILFVDAILLLMPKVCCGDSCGGKLDHAQVLQVIYFCLFFFLLQIDDFKPINFIKTKDVSTSDEELSSDAAVIISSTGDVPSVPAPGLESDVKEVPYQTADATHKEHEMKTSQDPMQRLNAALERCMTVTQEAVAAQDVAVGTVQNHAQCIRDMLEQKQPFMDKTKQWRDIEEAMLIRNQSVDKATSSFLQAKEELETLSDEIKLAREKGMSSKVLLAEKELREMKDQLESAGGKVVAVQAETQQQELAQQWSKAFWKELDIMVPGWNSKDKLGADEVSRLLGVAQRRVLQLEGDLSLERRRQESVQDMQQRDAQSKLEDRLQLELGKQRKELSALQRQQVVELRNAMEMEMRTQLKRQTVAHADHLQEALKLQEHDLHAKYQQVMQSRLEEQELALRSASQEVHFARMEDVQAAKRRLQAIEGSVEGLAEREEQVRLAHGLWQAIDFLQESLRTPTGDGPSAPLAAALHAMQAVSPNLAVTTAMMAAVPQLATERGIYTEDALRHRFSHVRKLARRVALVDGDRNSLYQYLLSYLQAFLMADLPATKPPKAGLSSVELEDPFLLLAYATYCLEHGDLEGAARLVNALPGEARRVADGWLSELPIESSS